MPLHPLRVCARFTRRSGADFEDGLDLDREVERQARPCPPRTGMPADRARRPPRTGPSSHRRPCLWFMPGAQLTMPRTFTTRVTRIERPELIAEGGEEGEPRGPAGFAALLEGEVAADLAAGRRAVGAGRGAHAPRCRAGSRCAPRGPGWRSPYSGQVARARSSTIRCLCGHGPSVTVRGGACGRAASSIGYHSQMETASVSETKNGLTALLDRVKAGESVLITERGVPIARLEPLARSTEPEGRIERLVRAGLVRPPSAPPPLELVPARPDPGCRMGSMRWRRCSRSGIPAGEVLGRVCHRAAARRSGGDRRGDDGVRASTPTSSCGGPQRCERRRRWHVSREMERSRRKPGSRPRGGRRRLEASWNEIDPTDRVRQQAMRLLRVHSLRAADSLQLAAAIDGG